MSIRVTVRLVGVTLVLTAIAPWAVGYIHFPPPTLKKMCETSTHVRVLRISTHDKEKGILLFEVVENLKGKKSSIKSFKHLIRKEAEGVNPILDWAGDRKQAVMFTIEAGIACGYVFIDDYCYSVDYNRNREYWLLIRAEPKMSGCYHGSVKRLQKLTKDVLDGKDVKVPVKQPDSPISKQEREKRAKEVTDVLDKNRKK
jgi:hypothetical protein